MEGGGGPGLGRVGSVLKDKKRRRGLVGSIPGVLDVEQPKAVLGQHYNVVIRQRMKRCSNHNVVLPKQGGLHQPGPVQIGARGKG